MFKQQPFKKPKNVLLFPQFSQKYLVKPRFKFLTFLDDFS